MPSLFMGPDDYLPLKAASEGVILALEELENWAANGREDQALVKVALQSTGLSAIAIGALIDACPPF